MRAPVSIWGIGSCTLDTIRLEVPLGSLKATRDMADEGFRECSVSRRCLMILNLPMAPLPPGRYSDDDSHTRYAQKGS